MIPGFMPPRRRIKKINLCQPDRDSAMVADDWDLVSRYLAALPKLQKIPSDFVEPELFF